MSGRQRTLGGVGWDAFWCILAAFSIAFSITDDAKRAFQWVLFGLLVLASHNALNQWPAAFDAWRESRKARR